MNRVQLAAVRTLLGLCPDFFKRCCRDDVDSRRRRKPTRRRRRLMPGADGVANPPVRPAVLEPHRAATDVGTLSDRGVEIAVVIEIGQRSPPMNLIAAEDLTQCFGKESVSSSEHGKASRLARRRCRGTPGAARRRPRSVGLPESPRDAARTAATRARRRRRSPAAAGPRAAGRRRGPTCSQFPRCRSAYPAARARRTRRCLRHRSLSPCRRSR